MTTSAALAIEFRHLRAFVTVAEELNFTRAAERIFMTQPSLSRSIAGLERAIGVPLVRRDRRSTALTPAGINFLSHARRALAALDEGIAAAVGANPSLRVCFVGSINEVTGPAVRTFEGLHPAVQVDLRRYDDAVASLADGRCHVAFLLGQPKDKTIDTLVLGHELRLAALPNDHPLARQDTVTLADLSMDTLVINVLAGTTSIDLWAGMERPSKFAKVLNIDEWLEAIAVGRGIGITPASTARLYSHPRIEYRTISDAPPVPVVIAWRTGDLHPSIPAFVAAAKQSLT
jgi:DNA-binding transcriptional LysR family regulator